MAMLASSSDHTSVRPARPLVMTQQDGRAVMRLAGCLDAERAGAVWRQAMAEARRVRALELVIDLTEVSVCDMAGAVLLASIIKAHQGTVSIRNGSEAVDALLQRATAILRKEAPASAAITPDPMRFIADTAKLVLDGVRYVGEAAVALVRLPRRSRMLRIRDLLLYADHAGLRALPLVALLGYLMGLILAFQSVIPMRRFGAEIYVANLVAVSLLRELGPLLAALILAGRTASAYAAEIGTMKVNEELDALVTMGLDPMTMLVLPRLIAVMLVMPVLTLMLDLSGLAGMVTVMQGFGFPLVTIARQVQWATTVTDLMGGLFKAMIFGMTVAAIGCRAGLSTGIGPRAVGLAATGAVVGGIVATILLDGLFALLFYRLGL